MLASAAGRPKIAVVDEALAFQMDRKRGGVVAPLGPLKQWCKETTRPDRPVVGIEEGARGVWRGRPLKCGSCRPGDTGPPGPSPPTPPYPPALVRSTGPAKPLSVRLRTTAIVVEARLLPSPAITCAVPPVVPVGVKRPEGVIDPISPRSTLHPTWPGWPAFVAVNCTVGALTTPLGDRHDDDAVEWREGDARDSLRGASGAAVGREGHPAGAAGAAGNPADASTVGQAVASGIGASKASHSGRGERKRDRSRRLAGGASTIVMAIAD